MNRPTRTALAVTTLAALALGTTACGEDDPEPTGATTATPAPAVTQDDADDITEDASDDTSQDAAPQAGPEALGAAVATALAAASGTVVAIDQEADGTWEVDVVAQDGSETSVRVSADGGEVTDQRPDDQDGDDVAENQQLLTATVDWEAALGAAAGDLTGPATEASLDEDDGRFVWEVSAGDDTTTVLVDASSGDVIGTEQD